MAGSAKAAPMRPHLAAIPRRSIALSLSGDLGRTAAPRAVVAGTPRCAAWSSRQPRAGSPAEGLCGGHGHAARSPAAERSPASWVTGPSGPAATWRAPSRGTAAARSRSPQRATGHRAMNRCGRQRAAPPWRSQRHASSPRGAIGPHATRAAAAARPSGGGHWNDPPSMAANAKAAALPKPNPARLHPASRRGRWIVSFQIGAIGPPAPPSAAPVCL
mmetsp:Transcript_34242/g.108828  ORF Transcript_34242/g.108828 Transcript_34242/m.108828 type:complete len:217 (+) Transcript_34242:535-1185(+)